MAKQVKTKKADILATFSNIQAEMVNAEEDIAKFDLGNMSAGARLRKALQNIKKLAQQLRLEVQGIKNAKKK